MAFNEKDYKDIFIKDVNDNFHDLLDYEKSKQEMFDYYKAFKTGHISVDNIYDDIKASKIALRVKDLRDMYRLGSDPTDVKKINTLYKESLKEVIKIRFWQPTMAEYSAMQAISFMGVDYIVVPCVGHTDRVAKTDFIVYLYTPMSSSPIKIPFQVKTGEQINILTGPDCKQKRALQKKTRREIRKQIATWGVPAVYIYSVYPHNYNYARSFKFCMDPVDNPQESVAIEHHKICRNIDDVKNKSDLHAEMLKITDRYIDLNIELLSKKAKGYIKSTQYHSKLNLKRGSNRGVMVDMGGGPVLDF